MTDKIIVKQSGAIARIIFNQPEKRNAVSLEMWEAVEVALDKFAVDKDVRVLILSGSGGKAFVSGADISKFESERASADGVARYNATTKRVYDKVEAFPKPTIAQIDGFCVGGGMALAVCCDIRICGQAEITGHSYNSVKSMLQPNKEVPRWVKLVLYVWENKSKKSEL